MRRSAALALGAAFLLSCTDRVTSPGVTLPPSSLAGMAFHVHVDVQQGTLQVRTPVGAAGPNLSLIAGDGVEVTASNFQRQVRSNKATVTFDVAVRNRLARVDLVTPTWPAPPAGVQGILLFPLSATPTGGDMRAAIAASDDWEGAPHDFFNATRCNGGEDDCFRWEAFAAPLAPGASTAPQRVGFELSARVTSFDAMLIVAADLVNTRVPLVANAGADQDVARGARVTLDGSGSEGTEGVAVEWTWTQVSGPDVTGGVGYLTGATPAFTAPPSVASLEFDLRVSDGTATTAPDRVQVNVMEDPAHAYFVAGGGSDMNPGTRERPFASIDRALDAAEAGAEGADVYVAAGTLAESVVLRSNVSIYGGFDPATWLRDPASNVTRIQGGSTAMAGTGVSDLTIEGLTILATQPTTAGTSSYGVRLANSARVVIARNVIRSAAGSAGAHGASGSSGSTGQPGQAGRPGSGDGAEPGNLGGVAGAGPGTAGGAGGRGGAAGPNPGFQGNRGTGTFGGAGGVGGVGGETGRRGADGSDGGNGPGGAHGAAGMRTDSEFGATYTPTQPGSGGSGGAGYGGGGGGGGGGQGGVFVIDGAGNGGGGGGAGGAGGTGGRGGQAGGGSFGIYLHATSDIQVIDNVISAAEGGAGGNGGAGGGGGNGGLGGAGATRDTDQVGAGGNGGRGGRGGDGGAGAGANGGHSVGILDASTTRAILAGNSIIASAGGAGGTSPVGGASNGSAGGSAEYRAVPE